MVFTNYKEILCFFNVNFIISNHSRTKINLAGDRMCRVLF